MNILFLNSIDKNTYGGVEEWARLVSGALARRGHQVTVAGRAGSEYLRRVADHQEGVRSLELNISGDFNPVTITRLKNYMAKVEVEIVIVNFNKDVRLGGLAARWEQRPVVVWRVGLNLTRNRAIHRYLTPRLVDGVIVPSQALKNQITDSGYVDPDSVVVIPNATDENEYRRPSQETRSQLRKRFGLAELSLVAVNIGRYVNQKGHRYLIDAAQSIVRAHPQVVFLLVGDGPRRTEIESRIAAAGLADHFVLTGMVERVDEILAGADLMVHSAIEEPFGFVLIEGMRAELPIVATRVGGIPEVVIDNETGLLVNAKEPEALAEAAIDLMRDRDRMRTMGDAGYERWEREFRLPVMVDRVESYLTAMVAEGRHAQA